MMFAIITPALISGAFTKRVTFKSYMLFLTGWFDLHVFPGCAHGLGRRIPATVGRDGFCRRYRRPQPAGFAALASVIFVGKRRVQDRGPHSIPLVALGTGFSGLDGTDSMPAASSRRFDYGFGLSEYRPCRVLRRHHLALDGMDFREETEIRRLLTGAIAGLATVTPAAG